MSKKTSAKAAQEKYRGAIKAAFDKIGITQNQYHRGVVLGAIESKIDPLYFEYCQERARLRELKQRPIGRAVAHAIANRAYRGTTLRKRSQWEFIAESDRFCFVGPSWDAVASTVEAWADEVKATGEVSK